MRDNQIEGVALAFFHVTRELHPVCDIRCTISRRSAAVVPAGGFNVTS